MCRNDVRNGISYVCAYTLLPNRCPYIVVCTLVFPESVMGLYGAESYPGNLDRVHDRYRIINRPRVILQVPDIHL